MTTPLKSIFRSVIRQPTINRIVRAMLSLVGRAGRGLRVRLPVCGIVKAKINRLSLRLYCESGDRITIAVFRDGLLAYEPETLQLFVALLPSAATVLDIGANTGLFALLAVTQDRRRAVRGIAVVALN